MNTYTADSITSAQARYLSGLLEAADGMLDRRQEVTGSDWTEARFAVRSQMLKVDEMTKREASAAISAAKENNQILSDEIAELEKAHGVSPVAPVAPVTEFVTTGMYQVGGRIFKVLPSRASDRHYAKELTGESETGFAFEYAKGAMRMIRPEHRMTTEQAAEFGRLTGSCCCCGRLLTDPNSIADGIGPVCKDKHFS